MHCAVKKTGDAYLVKKPRVSLGRRCRIVAQLLAVSGNFQVATNYEKVRYLNH